MKKSEARRRRVAVVALMLEEAAYKLRVEGTQGRIRGKKRSSTIEVSDSLVSSAAKAIQEHGYELGWAECQIVADELGFAVKLEGENLDMELTGLQVIAYAAALRARAKWMERYK